MKRRDFIKKAALSTAVTIGIPYILPTGRLFANTGARVVNHVVYVLFAGGIRQQESVDQQYLANQGFVTQGNVMNNMLAGAAPTNNLVYTPWSPLISQPLTTQGTLFKEVHYAQGPTGHYNGHTVAMTGNYSETGLNLTANPDYPTIFEYYRKHTSPSASSLNAWWISQSLGPYPTLNYSRHPQYGAMYGANYLCPSQVFWNDQIANATTYQPDDVERLNKIKGFLNNNFNRSAADLPGIQNELADRESVKSFILNTRQKVNNGQMQWATPTGSYQGLTGDLINVSFAWEVMETFKPELTVINTSNLDVCHDDFSQYLGHLHKADFGIGWLWNKIQNDPVLANDTIMICMPEHGRNLQTNNLFDTNGLGAYDHTGDDNSRRVFSLVAGPQGKIIQNQVLGTQGNPAAESIDMIPTIAHALGFKDDIPAGMLPGRALTEAFV
jgi:hypothetical protein